MKYKNADKCHKCPQSNGEDGCPWWWELMERNDQGQERLNKQCGKTYLPTLMVEVIKASNRPAAEMGAMRQEVAHAVSQAVALTMEKVSQLPVDHASGIEDKTDNK